MKESNRIEFKQVLNDDLEKVVVGFLNYKEGGEIYIGLNDKGLPIGVANMDNTMLTIKDRLKNNILPNCLGLFDVIIETIKDIEIIKVIVASGPEKPYYIKKLGMSVKGCFIRIGTSTESIPTKMIETLFSKRIRNSIGNIKSPIQKLHFEQLRIYYLEKGIKLTNQFIKNLELITPNLALNYVAYLMADENNISIKIAKYKGKDRVDLIESNEYGFCSIIKATKQVLDKLDIENKTITTISSQDRKEVRLWNAIAIREAIINAIVHNDYTNELPPKFEIFDDRIEITSSGGLPQGLSKKEFFSGYSVPRNKEIMRIFKDLNLVEQLGSGVPRMLKNYSKKCFTFTENFLRTVFPNDFLLSKLKSNINETAFNDNQIYLNYDVKINKKKGGQINEKKGGQINEKKGGQINEKKGGQINEKKGGQINEKKGGQINEKEGGQINEKKGGQINEKKGGQINEKKGGQINEKKGGQINEKKGGQINEKKGGQINEKKGGQINEKKGGQINEKKGGQINEKKGGQINEKKGGQINEKKGGQINEKKGGQINEKKGGQINEKKGGQINEKKGGQINEKKGGQINEKKGGQINEKKGGQINEKKGGQINEKKGGQINEKKGGQINEKKGGQINEKKGGQINEKEGGQINEKIGGQINEILNERQKGIYNLIVQNKTISRKEISYIIGVAESAIQKHLKFLTQQKVIKRVGTKKGYWKILING